jgi:aryl-alcohol dehydrogenase-like predicted oxidoreductase
MTKVFLPNGKSTTRIGFGCGPLLGGAYAKHSRAVIDTALESGFRHFDVAPSYGLGLAEAMLGQAIGGRDDVTVTTKVGIKRPPNGLLLSYVKRSTHPLLSRIPGWKNATRSGRETVAPGGRFDLREVIRSLDESRRLLKRDHIDVFLMHELKQGQASPELIEALEAQKFNGAVGALGVGTGRDEADAIAQDFPILGGVRQFRWNILSSALEPTKGFTITHGVVVPALSAVCDFLNGDPSRRARWSAKFDADLASAEVVAELMLGAALMENRSGIVLVHSQKPHRIMRYVQIAGDVDLQWKGKQLSELIPSDNSGSAFGQRVGMLC